MNTGPLRLPSLGSLEGLLVPCPSPMGEFSQSFPLWRLSCFTGRRAAACPNLQQFAGKQPFPPPSPTVLNGFWQRWRLNPPLWTFFALGFSICHPSVLAAASLGTASSLALRPVQPNAGWYQSLQNQGFSVPSLPRAAAAHAGMGNSSPVTRAFASPLETLNFHGACKMLWIIQDWEEIQSDGVTS